QRDQARPGDLGGGGNERLDPGPAVDRDRDQRQVFRQGQRHVRARVPLGAEALRAAQQDARGGLVLAVQVEQRVGGETVTRDPPSLPEVAGELDRFFVHRCAPISRPSAAAATPSTRLTTMFATALRCWRSSVSRWVSRIQVENVVYEPTAAVPAS